MQGGPSLALKRSHSPDDVLTTSTPTTHTHKRPRAPAERPILADAYLDCLSKQELIQALHQVEQLLNDTQYEADLYALLYPDSIEERVTQHHLEQAASAVAAATEVHPSDTGSDHAPQVDAPAPPAPEPAVPRPYTPSIPAPSSAAPEAAEQQQQPSSESPAVDHTQESVLSSSANISSRIAAILDSIHNTNSTGPMLNLQGQPLAPSKQASNTNPTGGGLSSLLSNANLLSNTRLPANSTLSKLLEQNQASASPLSRPDAPETRITPHLDVPRPTPGPFDYTRLATTSTLGSSLPHTQTGGGYGDDHHDDSISSQRDTARVTSTLPSYEDMIVEGLQAIGDVNGTPPRMLFHWMEDTYPLMKNFRPSASQALQKAFKRGRLHKVGSLYRINPDWDGSNTGRKPTRRPQVGKDHPMMVNGPKGPAPASPFKARAQFQGAAAYRQTTSPFTKQRNAHSRLLQSLRPGPKPYGQPGAAPLDNPASSIFQNGAAAAALLLAHQQRSRGATGESQNTPDLTPTLTSLVQQLRSSNVPGGADAPGSSLSSMLASALLKHAQRPGFSTTPGVETNPVLPTAPVGESGQPASGAFASSPVLQSLSRLLGTRGEEAAKPASAPTSQLPTSLPASGPGSLSASIETLMRQATRAAQASQDATPAEQQGPATSQADLDAAVSQTLEAAFQQIGPSQDAQRTGGQGDAPAQGESTELDGIDLSDYSDALRTLTAALAGNAGDDDDENERHLADERAIAEAEADHSETNSHGGDDSDDDTPEHAESSESRMASLLKSYGVDVSGDAVRHLTETLRDGDVQVPQTDTAEAQTEAPAPPSDTPNVAAMLPADNHESMDDAAKNQAIQSQLEALIASLAQDGAQSDEE
ncbi:uncharacterized protein MJAP1_000807 [Malassezia japonica]|uniref:Histone H1 n=1 Tax=Malassezia japonica TaxID=223818 RepID=A0AAF0J985_9BASI|nr:uncharacterized protein MJAP1_000807 [Malassezia japonica]WFD37860.1 hypothetical protein MJAP1_000807 [Malassezia japonica]